MPSLILQQIDQLTAGQPTPAQVNEPRGAGAAGAEFLFPDAIGDVQRIDEQLLPTLDRLATARAPMPILALAVTCELRPLEALATNISHVLTGCASRNVKYLNLAVAPTAEASRGGTPAVAAYDEAAHRVYTTLRDMRHNIEASGVVVTLEAGRHGLSLSPLELREVLDSVNSWAVGACVDLPHISTFSRPTHWIAILGRRLIVQRAHERRAVDRAWDGVPVLVARGI